MKVYDALSARLVFERRDMEITAMLAAAGAFLSLVAAMLSMFWFNRIL
jgi:Ca-activated chloride channel family protein